MIVVADVLPSLLIPMADLGFAPVLKIVVRRKMILGVSPLFPWW